MKILGNIIWWIFGGLEAAIGYFTGSLAIAGLSLAPFGKDVELGL